MRTTITIDGTTIHLVQNDRAVAISIRTEGCSVGYEDVRMNLPEAKGLRDALSACIGTAEQGDAE